MENFERQSILKTAGRFCRNPHQINAVYEADAEIVRLPGKRASYLVVKTDGIHEEIKEKLYVDPYLIGWMAVTAPVSDIAAVTATPTGILFSIIQPAQTDDAWMQAFSEGVNDACARYGIAVLGGDTSYDNFFSVSATVVTAVMRRQPLMRTGIRPGDHLYATAKLGLGNAFAYARFFDTNLKVPFQPEARLRESSLIAPYATACMDTSDGLFPALSVLSEINSLGFRLESPMDEFLTDEAAAIAAGATLPDWFFLAGPHGEYELLFIVPEHRNQAFIRHCTTKHFQPIHLGRSIPEQQLEFRSGLMDVTCPPALIPNLYYEADGNVGRYFEALMKQHRLWQQPT